MPKIPHAARLAAGSLVATLALAVALPAAAEIDGADEFARRCAVCHGDSGSGDGPYGMFLTVPPADLTRLSVENGGRFPFEEVYRIIDGRTELRAHGPREMPIWGYEYRRLADFESDAERGGKSAETEVSEKILGLIEHLRTLQVSQ